MFCAQENLDALGDVYLQETFMVWDPKQLIKKGRERHLFLFEMCIMFAKESKDSLGKCRYIYKHKLMVSILYLLHTSDLPHVENNYNKSISHDFYDLQLCEMISMHALKCARKYISLEMDFSHHKSVNQ